MWLLSHNPNIYFNYFPTNASLKLITLYQQTDNNNIQIYGKAVTQANTFHQSQFKLYFSLQGGEALEVSDVIPEIQDQDHPHCQPLFTLYNIWW